jgi:hypothetical protein
MNQEIEFLLLQNAQIKDQKLAEIFSLQILEVKLDK